MTTDDQGLTLSGADTAQGAAYDAVIGNYLDYAMATMPGVKGICKAAPDFAMAHILKGYLLLSLGTREITPKAMACHDHVAARSDGLSDRERHHLGALKAWASGDTLGACRHWDEVLFRHPTDILALKLQHFALFWMGRAARMRDAAARVLPAWGEDMPGYAQVLGMYAFGLEEMGDYRTAESYGRSAVERHPDDLWSIHAVAHVLEMQGRLDEGVAWLDYPIDRWDDRNPFKDHLWWHAAMFSLEKGDFDRVLGLYDQAVRPGESTFYLDVQNAVSLLARLDLLGVDVGDRWGALADIAASRLGDHCLAFTELHYAMAFGRSGRFSEAERQIASLRAFGDQAQDTIAKLMAPILVPLCAAIGDYYKGDYARAVGRMLALRYDHQAIGGSHAQRDILALYLIDAAIKAEDWTLARGLLCERLPLRRSSSGTWTRYAEICERLGDHATAAQARRKAVDLQAAA